ncbi:MAG: hypothetical protein ABIL58_05735 [Pseudomonadota bacterium]
MLTSASRIVATAERNLLIGSQILDLREAADPSARHPSRGEPVENGIAVYTEVARYFIDRKPTIFQHVSSRKAAALNLGFISRARLYGQAELFEQHLTGANSVEYIGTIGKKLYLQHIKLICPRLSPAPVHMNEPMHRDENILQAMRNVGAEAELSKSAHRLTVSSLGAWKTKSFH